MDPQEEAKRAAEEAEKHGSVPMSFHAPKREELIKRVAEAVTRLQELGQDVPVEPWATMNLLQLRASAQDLEEQAVEISRQRAEARQEAPKAAEGGTAVWGETAITLRLEVGSGAAPDFLCQRRIWAANPEEAGDRVDWAYAYLWDLVAEFLDPGEK